MNYRRFTEQDRIPVYRMFRDSIHDYMLKLGMVEASAQVDYDDLYRRQQALYLHLEQTAAEDWIAEDEQQGVVGWARSIERDGHRQLTHFFVDPAMQGAGVGRRLLQKAFPLEPGRERSIIATTNPGALSLYLRHGVSYQSMAFGLTGKPQMRENRTDLRIERAVPGADTLRHLLDIDSRVLGFKRRIDLEHFMQRQPVFLAWRDQRIAGYAFGSDGLCSGPAAALQPGDLPALLQVIETSACEAGLEEFVLMIPARANLAVDWALTNGYRIDPFYEVLLSSTAMQLDRYLLTDSTFLW